MDNLTPEQRLRQYLEGRMNKDYFQEVTDMGIQQDAAQQRQGELGMLEAATEIGQAGIGASNVGVNLKGSREAAQARLNDYLAQKKAERNAQYDQMSAAKELADMENAKARAKLEEDKMKQQARLNAMALEDKADYRAEMLDQKNREKVAKISDKLEKEGVNDAETVLTEVKGLLKQYPEGDIPGFGRFQSSVPGVASPTEWNNNRIVIESLASQIRKAKYGSAQSKQESENFLKEFGSGNVSSETLRKGLKLQQEIIENKKRNIFQGDPKAAKIYLENQQPAQSMVEVEAPKTVVKKQYSPSRDKTRISYSDGSEEIKDGRQ